jgi:hypothetical protein
MKRGAVLKPLAVGALVGLAGCAVEARTDHDAKFSVASCHSYAFADQQSGVAPASSAFDNPLNAKRLRDAIASSLAQRNLPVAADGKNADCLVSYAIGSRLEPDPWASPYAWGYGPPPPVGWGGRYYGGGAWGGAYAYRQGRVSIDLYDARSHQALWHSELDADVTELTGSEADQRIRAAVATIFEKFPVAAPGSLPNRS